MRRPLLLAALALPLALSLPAARAQAPAWPAGPVKFVNSFPPGGPSDLMARAVAEVLQRESGKPVIVENKAGAAGNIGADAVAKAPGDGSTVLFGIDTTFTVNPHIYKAMPFKPADLKPLAVIASSGLLVGVHPGTGFKSMQDLVAAGRGKGLTYSSAGSGSPGHLAAELAQELGLKVTHVPYKGNTPAVTAVLSGEVNGGVLATPGMLPFVQAGRITALAVTSRQRSPLLPQVPTVAEAGLPQLEQEVLYVVMAPGSTPEPLVQAMARAIAEAMARPEVRGKLQALDLQPEQLAGAAAAQRLAATSARYAPVIRKTGMQVE